jgi:hypothetical protein
MTEEKKKMNGCLKAAIIVGGIGVLAIGGCVALIGTAAKDVADQEKAEVARIQSEPVSDIQWEEIDKIYNLQSNYTELQKKEHWKNYKGKKVRWSGTVTSVGETFGTLQLQVKLNPNTLTSDVLVSLKDSVRSEAIKLQEGDSVTFEGVLDDWGSLMPVTLDHGIIINN